MNECTERARPWPDEPADVSPDELDEFLAHARAEVCPFHAEKVSELAGEFDSMFRPARGLDSHGRILRGRELRNRVVDYGHAQTLWKEASRVMSLPFKRIYITNRDEDIASSGKFYDFRRYEGDHQLDVRAGLQIWGMLKDEGGVKKVLLGFYPLLGYVHTGKETFLTLDNGYTVGLKVLQLDQQLFNIGFRCVETEALAKELANAQEQNNKTAAAGASAVITSVKKVSSKVRRRLAGLIPSMEELVPHLAAQITACVLAVLLLIATAPVTLTHSRNTLPGPPASAVTPPASQPPDSTEQPAAPKNTLAASAEPMAAENAAASSKLNKSQPSSQKNGRDDKSARSGSTATRSGRAKGKGVAAGSGDADLRPEGPDIGAMKFDSTAQTVWYLPYSVGSTDAARWFVVHMGKDTVLKEKLFNEIKENSFDVVPFYNIPASGASRRLTVSWDIKRGEKFVTVRAVLMAGGEKKVLSFGSEGSCSEQTCEKVIKDAVAGVFAIMQKEVGESKQAD
jgi:hypothetical protein